MGHTHEHTHNTKNNLTFAIAVSANFIFTITQIIFAFLAGSMSLMADAAHNFGDVLGLLLAWGASLLLTRPARERYSYGYKRTTILAALTNAVILVATSAMIAFQSCYKLLHPSAIDAV